ncbi:MAG TPA: response regulator [Steroidobacteraceae bacterium]|nr:response regulator [Steroidobacteraceae bacterium]
MRFRPSTSSRAPPLRVSKKRRRHTDGAAPVKRILVVDDDPDTRAMLEIWLTELGFNVSTAATGMDALSQVEEEPPDLIVTDQSMPRMTGLQLCNRLRARAKTRDIPIIMCSAQQLQPADGLYERAVLKPVSLTEISDEIVSLLGAPSRDRSSKRH